MNIVCSTCLTDTTGRSRFLAKIGHVYSKIIVNLDTLERSFETCAMFRPASTGLDHALVIARFQATTNV